MTTLSSIIRVISIFFFFRQHFENLQGSAMINSKYGNLDFPWLHQEENGVQEYVIFRLSSGRAFCNINFQIIR